MKKIKLGVLGAGRWGPNLIRNFHSSSGSEVIAVSDPLKERLALIHEKYPSVKTSTDPNSVIENKDIDAVVIVTPTSTHFELTKKAIDAGKHVFVEKPLAKDGDECRELIKLAKKHERTLFVGHVFVYNAGIQAVKKHIDQGDLGKILYIHATRTNLGPIRSDVNALWDLAPHDLSILQYWLGERPTEVSASGGRFVQPKLDDVVFATYFFPSKVLANVHVSWLDPQKIRQIVIVGEKMMLVWDDMDLQRPIKLFDKKVVVDSTAGKLVDTFVGFRTSIVEGETIIPKVELNEPLNAECMAFLRAIEEPSTSLSDGRDGMSVVEALCATDRSLDQGGAKVTIDYQD